MSGTLTLTRLPLRQEFTRKALHLLSAAFPIAWGLGLVDAAAVRMALLVLATAAIVAEAARASIPAVRSGIDRLAGSLFRTHETRGILGATWLAVAMALAVIVLPPRAALTALWAVAVGDAAAGLVGRALAPSGRGKTFAGSLACALAAAAGAWWLADAMPVRALAIGLAAAAAERPHLAIDDNLRVTLAAGLAAWGLGVA